MALSRVVVAWLGVVVLFLAWEAISGRLRGTERWFLLFACVAQALLLTLLGALWFASLGTGGWGLIFTLMGGLMELSGMTVTKQPRRRDWRDAVGRVLRVGRVLMAGAWLAWQLGPA